MTNTATATEGATVSIDGLDRFLSRAEVRTATGLCDTSIWRRVNAGTFPAPRALDGRRVGWLASEVAAWLASRPRVTWAPAGDKAA